MYGHNQFSQSPHYGSQYPPNFPPHPGNYYPSYNSWFQGVPTSHTNQEDSVVTMLKKREQSKKLLENYIEEVEESSHIDKNLENKQKMLRISEAREVLINALKTTQKLEKLSKELKNEETLADSEWQNKYQECAKLRDELAKQLHNFESDENIVKSLKKRVDQRRKKRLREKRKKATWKVEKSAAAERRVRRHVEADAWIREKQEIIEREKQVELLRKDADIVLFDVRGKRNDARKFLGLLQELQNLRRVKVNIARARGENLPLAADQVFDNIIGQLLDQWTCLDREYSIEEQGLKLMLKTDNDEKIEKQKKSTFDDWECVLFGKKLQSFDPTRGDLHTLVMIRHAWDKYACHKGRGSRIPIGWVMPDPPSSAAWQKCLKNE